MKNILLLIAIASITLLFSCSKQQQTPPIGDTSQVSAASIKQGQGNAIVRTIDTATKTITLDHNSIPGIMEAMTMEYPVSDSAMLYAAKVGDSVAFTLQDRGNGNYVVTQIIPMGSQKR